MNSIRLSLYFFLSSIPLGLLAGMTGSRELAALYVASLALMVVYAFWYFVTAAFEEIIDWLAYRHIERGMQDDSGERGEV